MSDTFFQDIGKELGWRQGRMLKASFNIRKLLTENSLPESVSEELRKISHYLITSPPVTEPEMVEELAEAYSKPL